MPVCYIGRSLLQAFTTLNILSPQTYKIWADKVVEHTIHYLSMEKKTSIDLIEKVLQS